MKTLRDFTVLSYGLNVIDDLEFLLLWDYAESRDIYPYENYSLFNLQTFDNAQCLVEFRFTKPDIQRLADALHLSEKVVCTQGTVCDKIEGLCILLKRLSYPCRLTDMVPLFGRNPTEICLIFNNVLDFIYDSFHHLLNSWNQTMLQPINLSSYADAIHKKGAPLENCFGFVDGTVIRISRPKSNQNVVYNGHKRVHAIKFQSLALPNGIIGNLHGPYEGKRHDSAILHQSGLLVDLQGAAWHNNQPLCIYGDPAYPLSVHLQTPYQGQNLTPNQKNYNKAMSQVRVTVEWLFGEIKTFFKFVSLKSQMKTGLSAVGKMYCVLHYSRIR